MRIVAILSLLVSVMASGAVRKISVEQALRMPSEDRISTLREIGPKGYRDLRGIAFDPSRPYEIRWRAVVSMAWLGKKESIPDLEQAIQSTDWFMRDAALRGFEKINTAKAKEWARKLLSDPALVVRSEAVQVLHHLHDVAAANSLWEKMDAPENFRGEQSLFIRRQILSALTDLAPKGSESKFAKFINDQDKTLHLVALEGLERSTGIRLDEDRKKSLGLWRKKLAQNSLSSTRQ